MENIKKLIVIIITKFFSNLLIIIITMLGFFTDFLIQKKAIWSELVSNIIKEITKNIH